MNLAVIFDMDGVLIDSQPLHYEVDIAILKRCGVEANLATVSKYTGIGNPERLPKYKEDFELSQEPEELTEIWEEVSAEVFERANLQPIAGVETLIAGIKAMGIKIGLASNSPPALIELVLAKTGLTFDFTVSGEDVTEGKPAPDIYLAAAKKAGVEPTLCVAIEDSEAGIESAKAAGCVCVAYKNPNTLGQDISRADYNTRNFDDCFPIIKTMFFRSVTGTLT